MSKSTEYTKIQGVPIHDSRVPQIIEDVAGIQSSKLDKSKLLDCGIESISWSVVRSEITVTTVEDIYKQYRPSETNTRYWAEFDGCPYFKNRQLYRVTFNDVVYDNLVCDYGILRDDGTGNVIGSDTTVGGCWQLIGNKNLYDSRYESTGEPFCIMYVEHPGMKTKGSYYYSSTVGKGILLTSSASTNKLKIEKATITQKGLPQSLFNNFGYGDRTYQNIGSSTYPRTSLGQGNIAGRGSFAFGNSNISTGQFGVALGGYNIVTGHNGSCAIGGFNKSSNTNTFASGRNTTASGDASHSEGFQTVASGDYSHAEGAISVASGQYSHAENCGSEASGMNSHAEGCATTASGELSHVEGYKSQATGTLSHAENQQTLASGYASHAEGYRTIASGFAQHVHGAYNIEDTEDVDFKVNGSATKKYVHIVGNGTSDTARSNAHTLDWNGNAWYQGTVECTGLTLDSSDGSKVDVTPEKIKSLESDKLSKPSTGIDVGKYFRVASIDSNGNPVLEAVDLPQATGTANGLMSSTDKTKLDSIDLDNTSLKILDTRTYTGLYSTASNFASSAFYFGTIRPDDFNKVWHVKYRVQGYVPGNNSYYGLFYVEFYGSGASRLTYSNFNNHKSTSYRTLYYHTLYSCTETGYNAGYGHLAALDLYSATNYTKADYKRTFVVDVLEEDNCTFTLWDEAVTYANVPGTGSTNYSGYSQFDGYNNGLRESGDDNEYGRVASHSGYLKNGSTIRLASMTLYGLDRSDKTQGISLYSSDYTGSTAYINTARVHNTAGFDYTKGLWYSNSSTNFAKSANVNCTSMKIYYATDLRYSDNCVQLGSGTTTTQPLGIEPRKAVFFRGIIKEDGLFYLAPMSVTYDSKTYPKAWTQDIPTSEEFDSNGYQYVYWFIGYPYYNSNYPYNGHQVNLAATNLVYWFHNGRFEEFNFYDRVTSLTATLLTGATTITFTDSSIKDTAMIDIYTDKFGLNPTDAEQSGNTLTITFDEQSRDVSVKVEVH